MPVAAADPETWAEIRKASEVGVDDPTLSDRYGVSEGAIRVRRTREKWLTMSAIQSKAQEIMAERKALAPVKQPEISVTKSVTSPSALTVSAEKLLQNGQEGSLIASRIALASLKLAPKSLPVRGMKELAGALSVVRAAAGMDKASSAPVQVNLALWGGAEQSWSTEPVRDVESSQE